MIELIDFSAGNHTPLVSGQNLVIDSGSLTALTGRNGCGKSTLLRVIAGTQKPLRGTVRIDGRPIDSLTPRHMARLVASVNTEPVKIERLTCRELVALGRSPMTGLFGRLDKVDRLAIDRALELVGMRAFASRQSSTLSDGESRRIILARALAQNTPVILLDEPTGFLDVPGRFEICSLLATLAHDENKTILYSTHELEPAIRFADSIIFMRREGLLKLAPQAMRANEEFVSTMRLDPRE